MSGQRQISWDAIKRQINPTIEVTCNKVPMIKIKVEVRHLKVQNIISCFFIPTLEMSTVREAIKKLGSN